MKHLLIIALIGLCLGGSALHAQEEAQPQFALADSLYFRGIFSAFQPAQHPLSDSIGSWKEALQKLQFRDSVPGQGLYIFERRDADQYPRNRFYVAVREGDTLHFSAFRSFMKGIYQSYRLHFINDQPLLELRYADEGTLNEGKAELRISAFFMQEGQHLRPAARIITSFWHNRHGSYHPACKDFSFRSIELRRNVSVKKNCIRVSRSPLVIAQNIDCEYSRQELPQPGGIYQWKDQQFTRK